MADGIIPGAVWVPNARNAGGTYIDAPWRIVLHTVEGDPGRLGAGLPAGHAYPPHTWYDPATRAHFQTVPLTRSAFALYQGNGPYTNKARALQVELMGRAATAGDWPDEWLVNIARDVIVPFVDFVRSQGADINLDHVPPIGTIGGSASEYAPQRLSYSAWEQLDGLCSHRHVPDNDHWDTGTLNIGRLVELSKELLGTSGSAGWVDPPQQKLRSDDVHVPFTLRPGSGVNGGPYIYDGELLAEGSAVPAQAATGLTVLSSQVVASVLDFGPNKRGARAQIVWGDGKVASGGLELTSVNSYRWSCPATGMASVVSDIPLSVHGETYAR
jgi:hypothetical protein